MHQLLFTQALTFAGRRRSFHTAMVAALLTAGCGASSNGDSEQSTTAGTSGSSTSTAGTAMPPVESNGPMGSGMGAPNASAVAPNPVAVMTGATSTPSALPPASSPPGQGVSGAPGSPPEGNAGAPVGGSTQQGEGGEGGSMDSPVAPADPEPQGGRGPAGGSGGDSASPPPDGEMGSSSGCGTETSLTSGRATIDVDGMQRDYILNIPTGYDSSQPYKLIYGLHWRGGQASDVATSGTIGLGNYYGLEDAANGSAIFVSPEGLDNGWANTGGRDIALMRAIHALLSDELCIDLDRVFSVGFSYGGMMSFAIACEMGDVFRAIAPISGALYSGCGNGTEPIAMWGAHGMSDDVVPINDGRSGLQAVLDRNHCGDQTSAVSPDPCVTYEGCDEGYPVTWCEFNGGHSPSGWMSEPIWEFFSQF